MKKIVTTALFFLFTTGGYNGLWAEEINDMKQGSIRGRIVDTSQQILPGASVYIEKLQTGVTSDINGFYTFPNLNPGTYKVKVSYVGYSPVEMEIHIPAGKTLEKNVMLNEGLELQEVIVGGAFQGQRRALNLQKNGMGITNVVSADQVGKFPDSNIGDALKRINGINVQYDQGEARFGQVRGTSADLTSVTVNGNRIPSAEGDTRNVQLDLIPADMVQTIEVNKVVTSDMDGDAIGGAINLVTKSTPYKRVLNATAGSGYNWISEKPLWNLGLTYGNRYLHNKLGVMLAASYQYAPGGSDNTEFEYDVDDDQQVYLDKAEIRQYYVTRERQSYSLAADYQFNANHHIAFKGMYNRRSDWENRYRMTFKKLHEAPKSQSIVLQTKAGSDNHKNARLELQQTYDFTLDGNHQFGKLGLDWAASYSRATEDRPQERYFGVAMKGKKNQDFFEDFSFLDTDSRQPYPSKGLGDITSHQWSLDELTNSDQETTENEWKVRLNFELPLTKGLWGNTLKFGAKYTSKDKKREAHCFSYADSYEETSENEWQNHLSHQIRNGFMPGDHYLSGSPFISKKYIGQMNFSALQGVPVLEESADNYNAKENIASAYIRIDQRLGEKLEAVAGLRMERTDLKYSGVNWIVDDLEDEQGRLEPTGEHKHHYTNWLPSLLLKYNISDDLKLRASYTQTLSRPKYSALVPSISYNIAEEEAHIGNSNLKPTTAHNFDLSSEYYFKSVGLISLGVFYKRIQDVIVDEVWRTTSNPNIPDGMLNEDGEPVKYEISKPINAYDADLFGVEVAYQRDFSFIAPALKAVGFYGTYTYTHSKTRNHQFEHRTLTDGEKVKMTGSPEHTVNASLYYEQKGINVRLSYNFASDFIDEMGANAMLDRYYDKVNYLDLNASYTWGKRFKTTVYAEANNLLNQPLRYYCGTQDRTMQVEYYGVKINAGVKISF